MKKKTLSMITGPGSFVSGVVSAVLWAAGFTTASSVFLVITLLGTAVCWTLLAVEEGCDPVTTPPSSINLHAQHQALSNYDYLNRFGGRYRTVCTGLYRVARVLVVSILNDYGDIQTNRSDAELFAAVAAKHPDLQYQITALDALRPFLVRGEVEPFDPVGHGALELVMDLRKAAHDLLMVAMEVREDTTRRSGQDGIAT